MNEPPPSQAPTPRRIITGLREDGSSEFTVCEEVEAEHVWYGGLELFRMWKGELPFELPLGAAPTTRHAPAVGDVQVTLVRYFPGQSPDLPFSQYHWHDTVDIQIVISGEIVQRLDDGSEVILRPGDVAVQTGTAHAWEARGPDGALVALVMHSATRVGPAPPDERNAERVLQLPRAS
jgi:hypothetical protein